MARWRTYLNPILPFILFLLTAPALAETYEAKVSGKEASFGSLPDALVQGNLAAEAQFDMKGARCAPRHFGLSMNGIRPRWMRGGLAAASTWDAKNSRWTVDLDMLRFEHGKSFRRKVGEIQSRGRTVRLAVWGCAKLLKSRIILSPSAPMAGLNWTETPDKKISSRLVEFAFESHIADTATECRMDGDAFAACVSSARYFPVANGRHSFEVRAVTAEGEVKATLKHSFHVFRGPLDVEIISATPVESPTSSASIRFQIGQIKRWPVLTQVQCRLDGGAYRECGRDIRYDGLGSGDHRFEARLVRRFLFWWLASDSDVYTWTILREPPRLEWVSTPASLVSSPEATFTFTAQGASELTCELDGETLGTCESPLGLSGLADGTHALRIVGKDAWGQSSEPLEYRWQIDTLAPLVSLLRVVPQNSPSNDDSALLSFEVSESATVVCRMDGVEVSPCVSPMRFESLAEGAHTFDVVATDLAGNASSPASQSWEIDRTLPILSLRPELPATFPDASGSLRVQVVASEGVVECELDGSLISPCGPVVQAQDLADGEHTLRAVARDAAGNVSEPAVFSWLVDRTSPVWTQVAFDPSSALTESTSMTATFEASENATFTCELDGAGAVSCTSPWSVNQLAVGNHRLSLTARDAAGNISEVYTHTWEVVGTALVTLTSRDPADGLTKETNAAFEFEGTDAVRFECALDSAAFVTCVSPMSYSALASGTHRFAVRGVNAANNPGPEVAVDWEVDAQAPVVTILGATPPESVTSSTGISLQFSTEEGAQTFCRLDNQAEAECTSPVSYANMTDGAHSISVRAVDGVGNSSAPAVYSWSVKTIKLEFLSISITQITRNSALVRWTTNFPASGRLNYGVGTAMNLFTQPQLPMASLQQAVLSGLNPGTQYRVKVLSVDAEGRTATSTTVIFNTLR